MVPLIIGKEEFQRVPSFWEYYPRLRRGEIKDEELKKQIEQLNQLIKEINQSLIDMPLVNEDKWIEWEKGTRKLLSRIFKVIYQADPHGEKKLKNYLKSYVF